MVLNALKCNAVRADGQIVPKRHRELEQDQIEWLDTLGYARSDSAKWDNEYPPPAQDTTRKEWRHLSKEQKEAAQKLGFTSKTWVSFWIEKQYSSVVLQRKERKEFLEKRISSVQLNSMWAHVESLSWTGDVVFSEDKWFEALVGAWKACELSGIEQALERYSIEYCETFKHHVAAGLQGHDSSDLDWLELSEAQRMGARTLGYDRDTWNSGRLPAVLKDEAGRKRAWNKLNQIEADAAHELDFTEESWNQADTLAVMDSTAITETIRWFTTRAHGSFSISNAKEYESAQECLEVRILLVFMRGQCFHLPDLTAPSAADDFAKVGQRCTCRARVSCRGSGKTISSRRHNRLVWYVKCDTMPRPCLYLHSMYMAACMIVNT
eukprot:COSAG01_NODE_241_length_20597_cov_8.200751_8_plen_380_part_00